MKKWVLALGAVALLAGCGSEEAEKKETENEKTINLYEGNIP